MSTTKKQFQDQEAKAVEAFQEELKTLCEKYDISLMAMGARQENANFSDDSDSTWICGFLSINVLENSLQQAKIFAHLKDSLEEEVREVAIKAMFLHMAEKSK